MSKKKGGFKSPKYKPFEAAGSLTYIGKEIEESISMLLCSYNQQYAEVKTCEHVAQINLESKQNRLYWLDVDGVHEPDVVGKIGEKFKLHPLLLEDILNTTQKPKIEHYEEENQIFVVLKMLTLDDENSEIDSEQISIVLGKDYVISFQEYDKTDIFENIHRRLEMTTSRIRRFKSDYLLYAMLDLVVDHYFILLDKLSMKLEQLEAEVLYNAIPAHVNKIYLLKKEMTFMRKSILPMKDILGSLIREESILVGKQVNVYLRDVQDHILQTIDTLDTFRDMADNIMTNYHAAINSRMNSVMKTFTVFTVIFMPLSFIAGVYGMNFDHMPELRWYNGYYYTLATMLLISIGLWIYFKWKKYI